MKISIYDEHLNRIVILEERFVSCLWSEGYNTTENFTLEVQATEELKKKIKVDCFVGRDDRPTMMVIKSVEYRDGKIIASGKQATRILDDMIMMGTIDSNSSFEKQIIEEYGKLEQEKTLGPYNIESKVVGAHGTAIKVLSTSTQLNGVLKDTTLTDSFKNNQLIRFEYHFTPERFNFFDFGDQLSFDIKSFPANIYVDGVEVKPDVKALESVKVRAYLYYDGIQGEDFSFGINSELGNCLKVEGDQIRITNLDRAKPFLTESVTEIEIDTYDFRPKDIYNIPDNARTIALDVGFFAGSKCEIKPVRDRKGTAVETLTFKSNGITERSKITISDKSFLDVCSKECQSLDYGLKVTKQGNGLVAEFYKPPEKSENIFSETFGNLKLESLLNSNENYKNYAIVLGSSIGDFRFRMDVDLSRGKRVNQMIVDARDLQFDEGDPWRIVSRELSNRGMQKLLEQKFVESVEFNLSEKEFGTKYDLGDMITARIDSFGITLKARIVRFTQTVQNNTTNTVVEAGNLVFLKK